ncbi:unnamed protein product [Calypogeia fissa]
MSGWFPDMYPGTPVELPDGAFVCQDHFQVVCGLCCCDYSFLQDSEEEEWDNFLDDEEESGGSSDSDDAPAGVLYFDMNPVDSTPVMTSLPLHSDDTSLEERFDELFIERLGASSDDGDYQSGEKKKKIKKPIDFIPVTRFAPPNKDDTPETLFTPGDSRHVCVTGFRFIRRTDESQILVYTDGACSNNGKDGAVGGCAVVFKGRKPTDEVKKGILSFRLEDRGPTGIAYKHTSNRAELRAVIGALQFRSWNGEGYKDLVIATDSEYVEKGATEWISAWVKRGWKTSQNKEVMNRDLWELLFKLVQKFRECSWRPLRVLIWRIPRGWNTVADKAAKEAAATGEACEQFRRIGGVMV